jgi:hypothetical protein
VASRSEEVFILLKAVGAAAARRQIDSVADALGRLNSETGDHAEIAKDETIAVEKSTEAKKKDSAAIKDVTKLNKKYSDGQKTLLDSLQRATKGETGLTNERVKQFKARQKVDALVKRANDQALKEEQRIQANELRLHKQYNAERNRALKEEERQNKIHAAEKLKVRNQTLREEAKLDRIEERERKARMAQEARDLKAQEKYLASHLSFRQRIFKKITSFKMPQNAGFNSPVRVAAIGSAIFGIMDLIPFLLTGLNAVAAASIAAVNGLSPLVGMFAVLPATIIAGAQAMAVFRLATNGMAKAIKGDQAALDALPKNAREFALAINILKTTYTPLQRGVQNEFFKGMSDEVLLLGNTLMPTLNKHLRATARGLNDAAINTSQWLRSSTGLALLNTNMRTNSIVVAEGARGLGYFFRAFMRIGAYASPMLRTVAKDFGNMARDFNHWVDNNEENITDFFNHSYRLYKRVLGVLGDVGMGIYNIFRLSAPLSESMGKSVEDMARDFRKWTESEKGIKAIKDYFQEMRPNIKAVAGLAGAVAKAIFDIGRSPNFAKTVDLIKNDLLPSVVEIFKSVDGKFLPAFITFIGAIETLAKSGVIDVVADVLQTAANAFSDVANAFVGLPKWTQEFIIWGLILYGIFAKPIGVAISLVGWIAKIAAGLKGLKAFQAIGGLFGLGSGAAVGTAGAANSVVPVGGAGKAAKAGKAGRAARVARGAGAAAGGIIGGAAVVAGVATAGGMLTNAVRGSGSVQDPFKNKRGRGIAGSRAFGTEVNSFGTALAAIKKNDDASPFAKKVDSWGAALLGVKTKAQVSKDAMFKLDTQLTQTKAPEAARKFAELKREAERQKIPMDKLIQMFPQYAAKVGESGERARIMGSKLYSAADKASIMAGKLNGVEIPAGKAGEAMLKADERARKLAAGIGHTADQVRDYNGAMLTARQRTLSVRDAWRELNNVPKNIPDPSPGYGRYRFAGGMTSPGESYVVGELGPEAAISRSGKMSLLGLGGMEQFRPSTETAIIPANATMNPGGGNYGNAPDWAQQAFKSAMSGGDASVKAPIAQNADSNRDTIALPSITITGNSFSQNIDLEEAISNAWKKMQRDRDERR